MASQARMKAAASSPIVVAICRSPDLGVRLPIDQPFWQEELVGHFGRGRGILDMVDQDGPLNPLGQFIDRLEFFVAEVLRWGTVQQGVDGAYDIFYFFAYGHGGDDTEPSLRPLTGKSPSGVSAL